MRGNKNGTNCRRIWDWFGYDDSWKCSVTITKTIVVYDIGVEMKQIIEYYGGAIIAVLLAGAILLVVGQVSYGEKRGIPAIVGRFLKDGIETSPQYSRDSSLEEYIGEASAQIDILDEYAWVAGRWNNIANYLEVKGEEGEYVSIRIEKGWKQDAQGELVTLSSDGFSAYFEEAGVYWMKLCITNAGERERQFLAQIFVNEVAVG